MASATSSSTVVLDTSALLAFLFDEPGGAMVKEFLATAAICAVNWAEVIQKHLTRAVSVRGMQRRVKGLGVRVVPFDADDAERCAVLWRRTHPSGLSLADRACLSLAQRLGVPALTADRDWALLDLGVQVRLIR